MDYKNAGVDIEAGYRSVELMKEHVKKTMRPEVLGGLGGFSGAFSMSAFKDMEKPTLVSGTDGVGTKLKLAFLLDRHDTVGIDCVAMCVNDIACAGGEPLFFLDYIACGKNYPEKIASIVSGVAEGCLQAGAALIGGETAEHPDLMINLVQSLCEHLVIHSQRLAESALADSLSQVCRVVCELAERHGRSDRFAPGMTQQELALLLEKLAD